MKSYLILSLLFILPFVSRAADIPPEQLKALQYDRDACIQKQRDDCVNTICPVSLERNCADQCQRTAEAKCQVSGS